LAQADTGVDFWMECGEGPALGAIEAAKEKGVMSPAMWVI
jgi:simple sugar transport system substrate-binding protein/basic membrane protein A